MTSCERKLVWVGWLSHKANRVLIAKPCLALEQVWVVPLASYFFTVSLPTHLCTRHGDGTTGLVPTKLLSLC